MRHIILTPCGIDFLTHGAESDMRERLKAAVNFREDEIAADELVELSRYIEERLTRLNQASMDTARQMCAELEGVLSLYDEFGPEERASDRHVLLPADAWLGRRVAQGLCDWLQWRGMQAEVLHIEHLHTRDIRSFRRSMAKLARTCDALFSQTHAEGGEVIFNLTGGFRDIRGFLRVVGMFYADETISGFQTSPELWSIPKLPVELNVETLLGPHQELFERLCVAQTLPEEDCEPLPASLIMVEDGWAALSEWGTLVSLLIQRDQRGRR